MEADTSLLFLFLTFSIFYVFGAKSALSASQKDDG